LKIAKQRNGPVDSIPFVFLGKFTRFEEAAAGGWAGGEE
jgi:replicative DNA helicase